LTQPTKTRAQAIDDHAPWKPPHYEVADVAAIQAVARGDATPEMQLRAIKYIIEGICGTYDFPYRPGGHEGERDTNVAIGRMFVGQQIVKMLKLNLEFLRRKE
jgi:hypothetical protein